MYPEAKVFIDQRTELYQKDFYQIYKEIEKGNTNLFKQIVEDFDIRTVFLSSTVKPVTEALLQYLYDSDEWSLVYFDYDAVIFVRGKSDLKIDLSADEIFYDFPKEDKNAYLKYFNRADTLMSLGYYDTAIEEATKAINAKSDFTPAMKLIGAAYVFEEKYDKANEYFLASDRYDYHDPEVRYETAICYYHRGDLNQAIKNLEVGLKLDPNHIKANFFLMHLYAQVGRYAESLRIMHRAHRLEPNNVNDLIMLRDFLLASSQKTMASEVNALINIKK